MAGLTQPPHRFTGEITWEDSKPLLNDNLEKIVTSVNDIGAKFSSISNDIATSVSGGGVYSVQVNVTDSRPEAIAGYLPTIPRVKLYVDTDNDDNYLWGIGGSLSSGQRLIFVSTPIFRGYFTGTNNVAAFILQVYNGDVTSHNIYFTIDSFYLNSPQEGYFR